MVKGVTAMTTITISLSDERLNKLKQLAAKANVQPHAFVDGNKRIGQAAMELFLFLNGFEINATVDEQERIIMSVAASQTSKADSTDWVLGHLVPKMVP